MKKAMKRTAFTLLAVAMLQLATVSAVFASDRLTSGQSLFGGNMLQSPNGSYTFNMQTDGNLVHYHYSTPLWSTSTNGDSVEVYDPFLDRYYYRFPDKLMLTTTGILKVTDAGESFTFWQADTKTWMQHYYFPPLIVPNLVGDTLVTHDDGTVVLYDTKDGKLNPCWATVPMQYPAESDLP